MSHEQSLARLAEAFGLRDIYAFGSRAREIVARVRGTSGDPRPTPGTERSDLDVAVQPLPGRALDSRDRVRLMAALEDLFDVPRLDLVVLSEASPLLAVDVIRGELLYSADPLAQAEHELYVLRRAADLAPFLRARAHAILHEGAR